MEDSFNSMELPGKGKRKRSEDLWRKKVKRINLQQEMKN